MSWQWGDLATWGALTTWGKVRRYTFSGLVTTARRPHSADSLWFPKAATGVTVYKDSAGTWGAGQWLDDAFLATCQRVYRGGYTYELDSAEVAELTAAGFGDYISV